ncbi:pentatricopeptide repeat-containing protein DOT4, chloroplastic-like [Selaginella moellendorffii]|uniref:pentatricopeptide repeat-containing protein DOT4, chloroplastic-like n=1 Tax=Selaginella moellendorffii TaxID=88036 RepID=UPI000D1CF3C5|nr:pentatricopeptide repeat-containing protein DOT4, chloroplastic-like [Selaginella moellendorffii]|eukprot:XP_024517763.1 pentatricopeptide repeat-containing protein DOT4, chloroplastic-like [Selaginella moellendorffii]
MTGSHCPKHSTDFSLNYPSIAIDKLAPGASRTISRIVTNVGTGRSSYTVAVAPPSDAALAIAVNPKTLDFFFTGQKLSYTVTLSLNKEAAGKSWIFSALTWTDGTHQKLHSTLSFHEVFLAGGSHPKFSIAATKTITASSTAALLAALKACSGRATKEDATEVNGRLVKAKSLQEGMEIHSQAGCLRDVFVASSLVDMYAKCGSLEKARNVFEAMPWQNVVSWNALMLGYAENGEEEACVNLLSCLVPRLRSPRTYAIALKACNKLAAKEEGQSYGEQELVKIKSLETGMRLHCQAARSGFDAEIFVAGSLIDMYAKCRSLRDARKVFDTIPCYDVVCWNSLMSGYIENGEGGTALALFDCLGSLADSLSYVVAFRACAGLAVEEEAKKGSVKWSPAL